jgi:hypothetical protein
MTLPAIVSTVVATRASIPFLRNAAKVALKVDVNRHCVDMALRGDLTGSSSATAELATCDDLQAFNKVVGESASSVVFSWPDDAVASLRNNEVLRALEGALRESHQDIATSKPFFMLDGGGRRMASLSVLGKCAEDVPSFNASQQDDFESPPGTWLRHYSLRSAANI